ncbi:ATP synthase-coupling factor 6, mitochondrial-like [Argiope bruennichi]|uniref:ATP synthase-coupling factor 6 like protein n=1 Tax=Argiope bruennichi TaxID=94029 RepID=A0A8T0EHF2_ARGBR|nr:ATP synthase-coupling factor 6, mitochondrial-like [Argiope bruennichi]KAF8772033.1 ATP synthase-coupling factor 6 like protein [Argiope bruennichi]
MNAVKVLKSGNALRNSVFHQRNFAACSVLMANKTATDPIQKLFLEKLKEYTKRSSGGKLVDVTPEKQKQYDEVLLNLKKQYGADKGEDFNKFPTFNFPEPKLDPINMDERHA